MRRCIPALLALTALAAAGAEPDTPPTEAEIERQIQLLGADNFQDRETAEQVLSTADLRAEQPLVTATSSTDAEVRYRASCALEKLRSRFDVAREAQWLASLGPLLGTAHYGAKASPASTEAQVNVIMPDSDLALEWLHSAQEPDGHWDSKKFGAQSDADIEQTGFALLAFLGAGHTEKVGQYKQTVQKGIAWLQKLQREDGAFAKPNESVDGIAHSTAGYAMSEAAGMSNKKETRESAQRALDFSFQHFQSRDKEGLFGFIKTVDSTTPDLLTTLFFVYQLKSSKVAGLKVSDEVRAGIDRFLKACAASDGRGYSFLPGGRPTPKATLAGCKIAHSIGYKREEFRTACEHARQSLKPTVGAPDSDPFFNLTGTYVYFAQGGDLWKNWNEPMKQNVQQNQIRSGANAGSWNPSGTWAGGGRVLTTALHCLSLEVYYIYQMPAH